VQLGDESEGARLERIVVAFGMEGYARMTVPYEVALATARGDTDALATKLADWRPKGLDDPEGLVPWLDALVALDRKATIDEAAPALVLDGTYLEPFALRALAFARNDSKLYERSIAAFEAMGLDWFSAQTRQLQAEGRLSVPRAPAE
jgi:hypothetical protein